MVFLIIVTKDGFPVYFSSSMVTLFRLFTDNNICRTTVYTCTAAGNLQFFCQLTPILSLY